MYASHADRTIEPYNTAYIRDDRSHLYEEFGIDRDRDRFEDAPADFAARREALLAFYGGRCGRCLTGIGATSAGEDALAYVYSLPATEEAPAVTADGGERPRWALEGLVPLCEPCYGLCSVEEAGRIDSFGGAARDAQQFPQWAGDPRVAVERVPLTGRELWVRNRLRERHDGGDQRARRGGGVSRPGDPRRHGGRARGGVRGRRLEPLPDGQRLTDRWDALAPRERATYERRAAKRREE